MLIPAFNEARVLRGCLDSLFRQTISRPMRIIVVANGCSDDTAQVARSAAGAAAGRGFELLVIELAEAGKAGALNLGDAHMLPGVRIYLDADIRLSADALQAIVDELETGECHLTAPALKVAPASSWITRNYAAIWRDLPIVKSDVLGCGLYAVSETGRRYWGAFPKIHSDDKFVRLSVPAHQRRIARRGSFTLRMPEGLPELIAVRKRWTRGNRELARKFPHVARREPNRYVRTLKFIASTPSKWVNAPWFILVFLVSHVLAVLEERTPRGPWTRAERAREIIRAA